MSRSGETDRPCRTRSSAVLTIAVTSQAGTVWTMPRSRRAAPTPPASTVIIGLGEVPEATLEQGHVGVDHHLDQIDKADGGSPVKAVGG